MASVRLSRSSTTAPIGVGTSIAAASSSSSLVSLRLSAAEKPKSKLRGNTARGHLSRVAELAPVPLFSTSIIRAGSSPALIPSAMPSAVTAIAVRLSRLLTSFIVCPAPGVAPM